MGDWSIIGGGQRHQMAGVDASTLLLDVQVGSPAHTKGSYVQMTSSTLFDSDGFALQFANANNSNYLIDVAIGPSGSETVILSNLFHSKEVGTDTTCSAITPFFPIPIPQGTRVSCRAQAIETSVGARMGVRFFANDLLPSKGLGRITTYGVNVGTTAGTSIDPGGAANTKGSWSVVSATTFPIRYLVVAFGKTVGSAGARYFVDIGIGSSGQEQILIPDIFILMLQSTIAFQTPFIGFPVSIPQGSVLSARAQSTDAGGNRNIAVAFYGVD